MDPYPGQQHASPQRAVLQLQRKVTSTDRLLLTDLIQAKFEAPIHLG